MRVIHVTDDSELALADCRDALVLVDAGVAVTLPKAADPAGPYRLKVKALGACTITSAAGIEVGDGATSSSRLTSSTSAIALQAGEVRELAFAPGAYSAWLQVGRGAFVGTVRAHSTEPVVLGTGDGSDLRFDLPVADVAQAHVFLGTALADPTTYSLGNGTGTGGADEVVFSSGNAPGSGVVVRAIVLRTA
jgi:hypothetical protein